MIILIIINIINRTLLSAIRAVISNTSMANNSTSDSECYLAVRVQARVLLLP